MTSTSQLAVVTGAAQGIGRRVAEVLANEGYALALTDLHDATETLAAVRERGREALNVPGDVSVEADVAASVKGAVEDDHPAAFTFEWRDEGFAGREVAPGAGHEQIAVVADRLASV